MMNTKGGTGIPFTAEIAYLGNHDMKNLVLHKWCSAQNSARCVLGSMVMMETRLSAPDYGTSTSTSPDFNLS